MIRYALATHRGEITKHPYEEGLAYNRTLAAAEAQDALKWEVDVTHTREADGTLRLDLNAHDAKNAPLSALHIKAILEAPADMHRDIGITFAEDGSGRYHALTTAPAGAWTLSLEADKEGRKMFLSNNRIKLD